MKKISLIAVLLLAGCAGEAMIFYKPDMTRRTFQRDSYECERDARQSNFGRYENPLAFAIHCMEARGYSYVPASSLTPATVKRIREGWNDQ